MSSHLVLQKIMASDYPLVIRDIAANLLGGYKTVGAVLEGLTNGQLEELIRYAVDIHMGDCGAALDNYVLLAGMLAQAEGLDHNIDPAIHVSNLLILVSFEKMYRNDLIFFDRRKATLAPELNTAKIAVLK